MYHKAYRIHLVKHQLSISRAHLVWQGESCRIHYISMRGRITMPYATYKRNSQTAQTASKNCVHISTLCMYIYNYIYTCTCIQICITCTCTAACRVCKALCYWVYMCAVCRLQGAILLMFSPSKLEMSKTFTFSTNIFQFDLYIYI